jgi:hypothetical protein
MGENMISVSVCLIGPASQLDSNSFLTFQFESPATIGALRERLTVYLESQTAIETKKALLEVSAFANTQRIFHEEDFLEDRMEYVLIAPISGG